MRRFVLCALGSSIVLAACGGGSGGGIRSGDSGGGSTAPPATDVTAPALPQLAAATGATLSSCADLATRITFANTTITSAADVAAGTLTVAGKAVPAHCLLKGSMYPRTGIDGNAYAIGFEMRLPLAWNGRFFYQANGGIDGQVVAATGGVNGGKGTDNALNKGFAVISSDAGHAASLGPFFGLDPQARLDYGYQAAAKLTPMAKHAIAVAYGKGPDRSYFGGCSNGGRHTMVAAARMPADYDGYLVGDPGFNLPKAATANIAGAQTYAALATDPADLGTGFTLQERQVVSNAVLAKCDALDGATDGLVQDTAACRAAFDLQKDVPTCSGARDGSCLSTVQKDAIGKLFAGATTSAGTKIYASFPYDNGLATDGWASWKFSAPLQLDSGAAGLIFAVPPEDPATFNGPAFALNVNLDSLVARINASNATYTESAMSFMTPPNPSDLSALKNRGAKMMIYHGTADPIFSSDDTTAFYQALSAANDGSAANFARLYLVPGMNHCSDGPSTDQFDMLAPLVNWVEQGVAPDSVEATARGPGNVVAVNVDVPADWAPARTRPLCSFPKVARFHGGSLDEASSFACE